MTRKDYELIAGVLSYNRMAVKVLMKDTIAGRAEATARLKELDLVAYALCGKLIEDNPRFDKERFLGAAETGK